MYQTTQSTAPQAFPPVWSQQVNQQYMGWRPPFPVGTLPGPKERNSWEKVNGQFCAPTTFNQMGNRELPATVQYRPEHLPLHGTPFRAVSDSWASCSEMRGPAVTPASSQSVCDSSSSWGQHAGKSRSVSTNTTETGIYPGCYTQRSSNNVLHNMDPSKLAMDKPNIIRHLISQKLTSTTWDIWRSLVSSNFNQQYHRFPTPAVPRNNAVMCPPAWMLPVSCSAPASINFNQQRSSQTRAETSCNARLPSPHSWANTQVIENSVPKAGSNVGLTAPPRTSCVALHQPPAHTLPAASAYNHVIQDKNAAAPQGQFGQSVYKDLWPNKSSRMAPGISDAWNGSSTNAFQSHRSLEMQNLCASATGNWGTDCVQEQSCTTVNRLNGAGLVDSNPPVQMSLHQECTEPEKDVDVMRESYKTDRNSNQTVPLSCKSSSVVPSENSSVFASAELLVTLNNSSDCIQDKQVKSESIEPMETIVSSCLPDAANERQNLHKQSYDHKNLSRGEVDVNEVLPPCVPAEKLMGSSGLHEQVGGCQVVPMKLASVANEVSSVSEIVPGEANTGQLEVKECKKDSIPSVFSLDDDSDVIFIDLDDDTIDVGDKSSQTSSMLEEARASDTSNSDREVICFSQENYSDDLMTNSAGKANDTIAVCDPPCTNFAAIVEQAATDSSAEQMETRKFSGLAKACRSLSDDNLKETDILSPASDFGNEKSIDQLCSGECVMFEAQHSLRTDECDFFVVTSAAGSLKPADKDTCQPPMQSLVSTDVNKRESLTLTSSCSDTKVLLQPRCQENSNRVSRTCTTQAVQSSLHQGEHGSTKKHPTVQLKRLYSGVEQTTCDSKLRILSSGQIFRVKRREKLYQQQRAMLGKDSFARIEEAISVTKPSNDKVCQGQNESSVAVSVQDPNIGAMFTNKHLMSAPLQKLTKGQWHIITPTDPEVLPRNQDNVLFPLEIERMAARESGVTVSSKSAYKDKDSCLKRSQELSVSPDCSVHTACRLNCAQENRTTSMKGRQKVTMSSQKEVRNPFSMLEVKCSAPFTMESLRAKSGNHLTCSKCRRLFSSAESCFQHQLTKHMSFIIKS